MATDVGFADAQAASAAILNKALFAGASKLQCKALWARIRYTGSAWEVSSSADSAQLVSGSLAWSTDHVNITLSGFTAIPLALVSPTYLAAIARAPQAIGISSTQVQVWFFTHATTPVVDSTQSTSMDCSLLIVGV